MTEIDELKNLFDSELADVTCRQAVEQLHRRFLGRKGRFTTLQKETDFATLSDEDRRIFGKGFNKLKEYIVSALESAIDNYDQSDKVPRIDLALPSDRKHVGNLHPISLVQMELEEIFISMGFVVQSGYEVETEYNNFDALNTPRDHPARDMQDTYWLTNGQVLRTQTSANQVRTLKRYSPPVRAIFPGRCFRCEKIDASHESTFYQLEGLMVDRKVSIANLIAVMKSFLTRVFDKEVPVRLRPGFFPFVEPGFELDIKCLLCGGEGCPTCKMSGWVELVPCGLVHPKVLEHGGLDSAEYSGFAFGLGLTRLAMMKYHIPQIRLFNSGNLRFNTQFPAFI